MMQFDRCLLQGEMTELLLLQDHQNEQNEWQDDSSETIDYY